MCTYLLWWLASRGENIFGQYRVPCHAIYCICVYVWIPKVFFWEIDKCVLWNSKITWHNTNFETIHNNSSAPFIYAKSYYNALDNCMHTLIHTQLQTDQLKCGDLLKSRKTIFYRNKAADDNYFVFIKCIIHWIYQFWISSLTKCVLSKVINNLAHIYMEFCCT